jgi:hypothetical protein
MLLVLLYWNVASCCWGDDDADEMVMIRCEESFHLPFRGTNRSST